MQKLKFSLSTLFFFSLLLGLGVPLRAAVEEETEEYILHHFETVEADNVTLYIVRLYSGDVLRGYVVSFVEDEEEGFGIRFRTEIGTATIYAHQVIYIRPFVTYNRNRHRLGLMPTADPIGRAHHIGHKELVMLFGGVGIDDIISIQAGRTLLPGIPGADQFSLVHLKATVYSDKTERGGQGFSAAVGSVTGWLNAPNRITNLYAVGTLDVNMTRVNAALFAKVDGPNAFPVRVGTFFDAPVEYSTGTFGFSLGFDTKFATRNDTRVYAELWTSNLGEATSSTAVLLGFRLGNEEISFDFGMGMIPGTGAFLPYTTFFWTPWR